MIQRLLILILSYFLFTATPIYAAPTKPQYVKIDTSQPIVIKTLKDDEKENFWPKSLKEWLDTLNILAPLAAIGTVAWGIYSYQGERKQKKFDFVSNKVKEFESSSTTINTLLMLMWGSMEFTLKSPSGDKKIEFNIDTLEEAFCELTEFVDGGQYDKNHIAIRYCFSEFLGNLDQLNSYTDLDLISKEDLLKLLPRLKDWLLILSNNEGASNYKTRFFYNKLWNNLIKPYNYKTQDLMKKYLDAKSHEPNLSTPHFPKENPYSLNLIKREVYDKLEEVCDEIEKDRKKRKL